MSGAKVVRLTARAQLQMSHLHAVVDAADHQAFLAPVELDGLAQSEGQRDVGRDIGRLTLTQPPGSNEVGDGRVAAAIARGLDLGMQRTCRAPLVLGPPGVGR